MGSEYKELTYKESLKEFNLAVKYTEEELKRSYKNLMRKYHPDSHIFDSEEEKLKNEYKAKQINEAYDRLLRKVRGEYVSFPSENKNNSQHSTSNNINLNEYKNQIIKEMDLILKDVIPHVINEFPNFESKINEISWAQYYTQMFCKTKKSIDDVFNNFKNKVKKLNELIKEEIFKEDYVVENELTITINYYKPIKVFCDEMKTIAKKYGKKTQFLTQLENEIKSYEYYVYYKDIKGLIDKLLNKSLKKAENRKFKKLDDLIVEFNTNILEEFNKCGEVFTLINNLINKGNLSELKLNKLKDILNNYSNYGYNKSMEIINSSKQELKEENDNKVTILLKRFLLISGADIIFKIKENLYYIDAKFKLKKIDTSKVTNYIADNYTSLEYFLNDSIYVGKIGIINSRFSDGVKYELLYMNDYSVLVRHPNGRITLDDIRKYKIPNEEIIIYYTTYEELEKELLSMFENAAYQHIENDVTINLKK